MAPEDVGAFRYGKSVLGQEYGIVQLWEGIAENAVSRALVFAWCDLTLTRRKLLGKGEEIHTQ